MSLNPPTDSLYKFLAIGGLVALLWGLTVPWQKADEYETAKLHSTQAAENYKVLAEMGKVRLFAVEDKKRLNQLTEAEYLLQMQEIVSSLTQESNRVAAQQELVALQEKSLATYHAMKWLAIYGGGGVMLVGFGAWYFLLQRHLDFQVKAKKA